MPIYGPSRLKTNLKVLIFLLVLSVFLSACGNGTTSPVQDELDLGNNTEADESPPTGFPLNLTDASQRAVVIPAPPQRIIALAPNVVEILLALDAGDRIVGVDDFTDESPETAHMERIGGVLDHNLEKMLELEPDLFISIQGAEEIADQLAEFDIPGLITQPESFAETLELIQLLGTITEREEAAAELVASLSQQLADLQQKLADTTPALVFFEVYDDPLMTVGPGAFIHDLIGLAGGKNLAHDAKLAWPQIGLETVVQRDPEVIVVMVTSSFEELMADQRPGWSGISAVVNQRIHLIDEDLISRPGPNIATAVEELAKILHPDIFP